MNILDFLENDHRLIEKVLDCIDGPQGLIVDVFSSASLDQEVLGGVVDFLNDFVDGVHHAREEKGLFPFLETKGFPHAQDEGPLAVMREEHEQGRVLVKAMSVALKANRGVEFCEHARRYCDLMRGHIFKEDHHLFPMASSVITEDFLPEGYQPPGASVLEFVAALSEHFGSPQGCCGGSCGDGCGDETGGGCGSEGGCGSGCC